VLLDAGIYSRSIAIPFFGESHRHVSVAIALEQIGTIAAQAARHRPLPIDTPHREVTRRAAGRAEGGSSLFWWTFPMRRKGDTAMRHFTRKPVENGLVHDYDEAMSLRPSDAVAAKSADGEVGGEVGEYSRESKMLHSDMLGRRSERSRSFKEASFGEAHSKERPGPRFSSSDAIKRLTHTAAKVIRRHETRSMVRAARLPAPTEKARQEASKAMTGGIKCLVEAGLGPRRMASASSLSTKEVLGIQKMARGRLARRELVRKRAAAHATAQAASAARLTPSAAISVAEARPSEALSWAPLAQPTPGEQRANGGAQNRDVLRDFSKRVNGIFSPTPDHLSA
jgi:hypothetical protein